ncbi:RNA-binding protein squid-like isoform X1 [Trichogramma pretiosum]|uniref:RNA-binding protein squid-like isoform X1 n=1 Tax=Trichogramma pretiosum TaxID=7493 RepID=UPI0006C973D8|nr:RNA-binding protein squid-like isoform X1 [Trichogramma pretiosum]XP_014233963.1 RNA-binding protein squid-like isoform X1 [Trichogramma pretiosum]
MADNQESTGASAATNTEQQPQSSSPPQANNAEQQASSNASSAAAANNDTSSSAATGAGAANNSDAAKVNNEASKTNTNSSENSGNTNANAQQQPAAQQQQGGEANKPQQATAGIPGKDDERKLFVGGLTRNTTENELKEYFTKFGEIESVSIKIDPYTGISRGFAFMVFNNPKAIDKLLSSGDHYINKRKVDPKRVSKKAQHGKIFVGGLTPEISDEDIKNYFGQYGTIVEVQAPFDKTKNQRRSYCFVTFDSKEVVYKLLRTPKQTINGKEIDVKKVKVNQDQRQAFWNTPYGGYGYGGGYHGYLPTTDYNGYDGYDMYNFEYTGFEGYENLGYGMPGKPRNGPAEPMRSRYIRSTQQ